jgi:hypothetical protein
MVKKSSWALSVTAAAGLMGALVFGGQRGTEGAGTPAVFVQPAAFETGFTKPQAEAERDKALAKEEEFAKGLDEAKDPTPLEREEFKKDRGRLDRFEKGDRFIGEDGKERGAGGFESHARDFDKELGRQAHEAR